jgi:hypothetical protein
MGLNWLEDTVSCLYKLKGYIVIENEDLILQGRHSDIDIIALKEGELLHIECQSWWGPSPKDEGKDFQRLKNRFENSQRQIFDKYKILDKDKLKLKKIFVTSGKPKKLTCGPWKKLQDFCDGHGIELIDRQDIIKELISELKKRYPHPSRVGKEEGITRFLLDLIHFGFIKDESRSKI